MTRNNIRAGVVSTEDGDYALISMPRIMATTALVATGDGGGTNGIIYDHATGIAGTKSHGDIVSGGDPMDYPRNIQITTDTGSTTAGDFVFTGIDQFGDTITETITVASGARTVEGVYAFSYITSYTYPAIAGAHAFVERGQKIGVPIALQNAADLKYAFLNGTPVLSNTTNFTVNTTYNTIDYLGADYSANDIMVFGIWA